MKTAILYTRVSTEEQKKNGYSLMNQYERLQTYCARHDIQILHHFQDDHSAKTFRRPAFTEMRKYMRTHKRNIDLLLFLKWDRFSRNLTDALAMVRTIRGMEIEPNAIDQWIDFSVSYSKYLLAMALAEGEVSNDARSESVIEAMRRIQHLGGCPTRPPYGYKRMRTADKVPTLAPNEKAHFISRAFELYATGQYSQEAVRKILNREGAGLDDNNFNKILKNKVYAGYIRIKPWKEEPGTCVRGLHEPIVPLRLFEAVQKRIARGQGPTERRTKLVSELPLRGHLTCHACGGNLTGSASRGKLGGRYYYYHCRQGCKVRHKAPVVHEAFLRLLQQLKPAPQVIKLYDRVLRDIFKENTAERHAEIERIRQELAQIETSLLAADNKFIADQLPSDRYHSYVNAQREKRQELQHRLDALGSLHTDLAKHIRFGLKLVSNLDSFFQRAPLEVKSRFVGSTFPEKLIFENEKCRTPKVSDAIALFCGYKADLNAKTPQVDLAGLLLSPKVSRRGVEPLLPE